MKFSNPTAFMAAKKSIVDEAFPGDIVGLYDPGNFKSLAMAANLLRRLLSSFLVLFGILVITFVLARLIPTHPCEMLLYEKSPPEVCEKFMRDKGLDKPIPVQLGIYIKDVFQGDFGNSIRFNRPAIQILVERLPASIELSLMAFLIAVAVGIPIGILSAIYNRTPFDSLMLIGANFGVSVPVFWLGLLLMFIFAVLLKDTLFWLPPSGRVSTGIISIPFYEVYEISLAEGSTMSYLLNFLSNHFC